MYKKGKSIISSKEELGNYIEGFDVYNSSFLTKLLDPSLPRDFYQITRYEYRPDLIAKEIYGSSSYMAILMVQVGMGIENYKKGAYITILPRETVGKIISEM